MEPFIQKHGLEEYKDYIFSRYWNSEVCLFYGNCHMNIMQKYFKGNLQFQKYDSYLYRIDLLDDDEKVRMLEDIKHAKAIIMQDIRPENRFGCMDVEAVRNNMNNECKLIVIPNVYGLNLFYPQIDLKMDGVYDEEKIFFTVLGRGDVFVEESFRKGKTVEYVIDMIQQKTVKIFSDVTENFANEINKLKQREKKCDITISDFILEKYKEIPLFYEPLHPTNYLIFEKCRRICDLLGIQTDKRIDNIGIDYGCDQQEAFIYECVRNELGLKYKQNTIRNNTRNNLFQRGLDVEEFVRQYYGALKLKKVMKSDDLFYE